MIAYASRCLSRAERNYNTTRRELLAVIFGLKQFSTFLLERQFLLRVDHSALSFLKKTPEIMGQAARWLEFIEEYTFTIQHRSGASHGNCDALSRRPCGDDGKEDPNHPCCRRTKRPHDREADREAADRETDESLNFAPEFIAKAQQADVDLKPILDAVVAAAPRSAWYDVQSSSEETRALWAQYKSLQIIDSVLFREFYRSNGEVDHLQIVMPVVLRIAFIRQIHESNCNVGTAHLGIKKTQWHVGQRAYLLLAKLEV